MFSFSIKLEALFSSGVLIKYLDAVCYSRTRGVCRWDAALPLYAKITFLICQKWCWEVVGVWIY